ncbi:MAG TPA: regulatory iron-sulfur-containing complex subunit RicT [Erysipelothrix sp.]|nr:regulatory iron-sulfur-containing complex subunit RicT [Erysipelothrix sp.]
MNVYLVNIKGTSFSDVFASSKSYDVESVVVVSSDRGLELGKIIRVMHPMETIGQIEGIASAHDIEDYWLNIEAAIKADKIVKKRIKEHKLGMRVITTDYNLDRSKIFINYTSDRRVDFRDLLKDLSNDLRTRIELKQLGARDHAKIVGGLGSCGQIACCMHKRDFESITMKMAKNQMLTLNNDTLSGVCGSLKCCLAYENDMYFECRKNFPKIRSKVNYLNKEYTVQDFNCISEEIQLVRGNERVSVQLKELRS